MDVNDAVAELRVFLRDLGEHPGPKRIPPMLYVLASGPGQSREDLEDTVSAFLLKTLTATRKGSPGSAEKLLDLGDNALVNVLRVRLQQSACSGPRWAAMKSLRVHVRVALEQVGPDGAEMPVDIRDNDGRLCRHLVLQAVTALMAGPNPPPRSVSTVADVLFRAYLDHGHMPDVETTSHHADEVALEHDAVVEARRLERVLGDEAGLLADHARGVTLSTLARRRGIAPSTAHGRLRRARARLRRRGANFEVRAAALQLLGRGGLQ